MPAPKGLTRLFLRTPIWLYRLGLGWLLGKSFLLLTHTGRKSGLARQVVLEVVRRDEATGGYIIASGWGEKSNWLLNIQKKPQVKIQVGARRMEAVAVRLSPEEAKRELLDYARRRPFAFRTLARRKLGERKGNSEEMSHLLAQCLPLVALKTR